MRKIQLKIDKNKKYILACSFGPDSMALLGLLLKEKIKPIIAHVNYHHRDVSNYEEKELKKFAKIKELKVKVLNAHYKERNGNFEAWARDVRYNFFKKLSAKYKTDAVLVAHNQDDLLETYLMQKKRDKYVKTWGLSKENTINGTKILRPLLNYKKEELNQYCIENKIPFSIDITNFDETLERNKTRHQIVKKLSNKQRQELIEEINKISAVKVELKSMWKLAEFKTLSYFQFIKLIEAVFGSTNTHTNISKKYYVEIMKKATSKKANIEIKINKKISIYKSYSSIYIINNDKIKSYSIKLPYGKKYKNEFLDIDFNGNEKERKIEKIDFPLIIKNLNQNGYYKINKNKCEIRRLFIDWRMPLFLRRVWPGVYDKKGNLIYIPRYRETFVDKHKSKFVIDITNFFALK